MVLCVTLMLRFNEMLLIEFKLILNYYTSVFLYVTL